MKGVKKMTEVSIRVSAELRKEIEADKLVKNESIDEVLKRWLEDHRKIKELSCRQ